MASGNKKSEVSLGTPATAAAAAASTESRVPSPESRADPESRLCPALLVSAPASGQGKTSVTAAIARWHARQGRRVRVFKTGPDFLDPMVLERASGQTVYQLDLWMCGEQDVRARLHAAAGEADLILVEGVMGLFDGAPSSADLAQRLGIPVLAVIDGSAMAQTFGALATGLARYRDGLQVYGVAANRIGSAYHAQLLRDSLPPDLRWLGALPRDPGLALPERHLGLVAAGELGDLDARLDALADAWGEHADASLPPPVAFAPVEAEPVPALLQGVRVAIARDAAFCFLYPANLELLRAAGAELGYFSPLAGDGLPECDAVWLPGGYPELHLQALADNRGLREALHAHRDAGKPLLAECGGLLYALDSLTDRDGQRGAMAGLLPGRAVMQTRMAALGLQAVELPEGGLRGHTFHYARAEIEAPAVAESVNPNGGPSREAVYRDQRMSASFVHFYFPSNPAAALQLLQP
jgi:cobyrinic acid a,c-diamide synthase